jgi:hypothetical protein
MEDKKKNESKRERKNIKWIRKTGEEGLWKETEKKEERKEDIKKHEGTTEKTKKEDRNKKEKHEHRKC